MNRKEFNRLISIFLLFSLILFCFLGCRMRAEQNSLTSQFDVIDALVMQNQMQSALKELKKALADFYFDQVEKGMAELEAKGLWSKEKCEEIANSPKTIISMC